MISENTSLYDLRCCGNKYFRLWCVYCVSCSVRLVATSISGCGVCTVCRVVCDLWQQVFQAVVCVLPVGVVCDLLWQQVFQAVVCVLCAVLCATCGNKYFRLWCVYCVPCCVRLVATSISGCGVCTACRVVCDLWQQNRKSYNDVFLLINSTKF